MPMPAPTDAPERQAWPALDYAEGRDTWTTLHLWTQIVGKIRVAQTPWLNHQWHVVLYLSARGLTTSTIPCGGRVFEAEFDFIRHVLEIRVHDGGSATVALRDGSIAGFHADVLDALARLDIDVRIH